MEKQKLRRFLAAAKEHFVSRLLGIVYTKQRQGERPERHSIASGFILLVGDYYLVVTAGHTIQQIGDWYAEGYMLKASFIVPTHNSQIVEIPWPDELYDLMVHWNDENGLLDVGVVPIPDSLKQQIYIHDLQPIDRSSVWNVDDFTALRLIVGFSGKHLVVNEVEQFGILEGGRWKPILKAELSKVSTRVCYITSVCSVESTLIRSQATRDDTPSVAGMSGGMVIDLPFGKSFTDYKWVGIQSSETKIARRGNEVVTSVSVVDSRAVLHLLDKFVKELEDDFDEKVDES